VASRYLSRLLINDDQRLSRKKLKQTVTPCPTAFGYGGLDDDSSKPLKQKADSTVQQERKPDMKNPRDYYPPEYLAEVQAQEQRVKQNSMKRHQRRRVSQITVQRLPSGCFLYQLAGTNGGDDDGECDSAKTLRESRSSSHA
jgi:hypothetical protein